ncbi:hypothetical protein MSAN_01768000 [Mycena sanguinolenta]|uniref:Uncharacterized protein n=1 Tax=Mycena sanguinolenta TaxID=230812 RepID=A0A8H6XX28_9AGAR|nr:hypothetical protein MSAN_01768000 [Mycena sanguinolenta]
MTQNSRAGVPKPLPDNFDCDAYMTRPGDVEPPAALSPADLNAWNLFSRRWRLRRLEPPPPEVGNLDVGAPLQPLYAYSPTLKKMYLHSKEFVDATGPLPSSLVQWLAMERIKAADEETAEKSKREEEKAKAIGPSLGTLVMTKPVSFSSVVDDEVEIPKVFLVSLGQKIYPPLQWWKSSILRTANESPHSLPTTSIRIGQGTSVIKLDVLKYEEMTTLHGGIDDWTSLTPSTWLQCSMNLLAAMKQLSIEHDAANPQHSPYTEYAQHIQFFKKNKWFDTHFHFWYPQEYEMRKGVLVNTLFDHEVWVRELSATMKAHEAAEARETRRLSGAAGFRSSPSPFTPAPSPGLQQAPSTNKRGATDDGNGGAKRQRKDKGGNSQNDGPPRTTSASTARESTLHLGFTAAPYAAAPIPLSPATTHADESREETSFLEGDEAEQLDADIFLETRQSGFREDPQHMPSAELSYPDLLPFVHDRPALGSEPLDLLLDRVTQPYDADAFDRLLAQHSLTDRYPQLTHHLRHGFPLGRLPELDQTIIIPNHRSALEDSDVIREYLDTEISKGRMSGPYTREEMERICRGPFFSSPLIVATQDQGPGLEPKKRVCRHLSKGDPSSGTPSVNDHIDKEDFPTRFDMPSQMAELVATAPAGTQACAFDVKSFHRTCPVLPAHKPWLVCSFDELFYLDHCHPFGAKPASSNAGQIVNAAVDIWQVATLHHARELKYEDDCDVVRFPSAPEGPPYTYKFDRNSILDPIRELRIPWHPTKTGDAFLDTTVFLGLEWDFPTRRVSLPTEKRLKYLSRVQNMLKGIRTSKKFTLLELQEIHGSLCYVAFVYKEGSSRLAVFSNGMSSFKSNKFSLRWLSESIKKALIWWERKLLDASFFRQLSPLPPLRDVGIFVDASTSWGIAVVIGTKWHALQLKPNWKQPGTDICWLESVAIELCALFLEQLGYRDEHLLIRSDNKGAIGAHKKGRSPNVGINLCARRTYAVLTGINVTPNIVYVASADNIADAPSRGLPSSLLPRDRLWRNFELPRDTFGFHNPRSCARSLLAAPRSFVQNVATAIEALDTNNPHPISPDRPASSRFLDHTGTCNTVVDSLALPSTPAFPLGHDFDPLGDLFPQKQMETPRHESPRSFTFTEPSFDIPDLRINVARPKQSNRARSASPARRTHEQARDVLSIPFVDGHVSSLSRTGDLETDMNNIPLSDRTSQQISGYYSGPRRARSRSTGSSKTQVSPLDTQRRAFEWLSKAHVADTRGSYGAGLLRFHQWCDQNNVAEASRLPASRALLIGFVSDAIGTCTGKCIRNWLNGLHLWHTYNGLEWHGDETLLPSLKKAADKAGARFKRPERGPVTKKHLRTLRAAIDLHSNFGAAVWANALAVFHGCRRLGETLITSANTFSKEHDTTRDTRIAHSKANGREVIGIHLVWTKTTGTRGGELILTEILGEDVDLCPRWAWLNHIRLNHSPPPNTPLFAFRTESGWRPLTKDLFLRTTDSIYKANKLDTVFGHSYRIGGALALLLAGVAPEVIMKLGGWSSLCFLIYWRRLQLILPLAITRAWDARIREFADNQGLAADADSLSIDD